MKRRAGILSIMAVLTAMILTLGQFPAADARSIESEAGTSAGAAPALAHAGLSPGFTLSDFPPRLTPGEFLRQPEPHIGQPAYSPLPPFRLAQNVPAKEAYEFAREIDSVEAWEAFLRQYPSGFFSDLARARLSKLPGGANSAVARPATSGQPSSGSAGVQQVSTSGDADDADDTSSLLDPSDPAGLFDVRRGAKPDTASGELTPAGEDPYLAFEFAEDDFYICLEACADDAQCKSWSYSPPTDEGGASGQQVSARCELSTAETETTEVADCPDCVTGIRLEDGEARVPLLDSEVKDDDDAEVTFALGAVSACPRGLRLEGDECVAVCEDGERLVRGQCRSLCGEGTFWDGEICVAERPRCWAGSEWRNGQCRSICGSGSAWNGIRCVVARPQCGENYRRVGGRCVWRCDVNEVSIDGICSRVDCGPNRTMRYGSCVRYRPDIVRFSCPRGMRWNGEACEYSCGLGRDYDYISGRCLWIPYNGFCGRGYRMTDSGLCAPRRTDTFVGFTCPFGLRRSGGLCVSIILSGVGTPRACPRGWQFRNGTCQRFCPAGSRFDPNSGRCRQIARNGFCGVGLQIGPLGLCLPVVVARTCQPGFALRNGRCRAVAAFCPSNFRRVNGRCVPIVLNVIGRPGCPNGTRLNRNGRCVALQAIRIAPRQIAPVVKRPNLTCPAGTRPTGKNRCTSLTQVCSLAGNRWNCAARGAPRANAPARPNLVQQGRTVCRGTRNVDFSKCDCPKGTIASSKGGTRRDCVKEAPPCPLNKIVNYECNTVVGPNIVCVRGAPIPGGGTGCFVQGSPQHKAFVNRSLQRQGGANTTNNIPPPIVKQVRTPCPAGTRSTGNNRCTGPTQVCNLVSNNWNCVTRNSPAVKAPAKPNAVVTCAQGQRRVGNRCLPIANQQSNKPNANAPARPNAVVKCAQGQRRVGTRCVPIVRKPATNPAVKGVAKPVVRCPQGQRRVGNRCVRAQGNPAAVKPAAKAPVRPAAKQNAKPALRCPKGQRIVNGRCIPARQKPAAGTNQP